MIKFLLTGIFYCLAGFVIAQQIPQNDSVVTLSSFEVSASRLDDFVAGQKKSSFDSLILAFNINRNLDELLSRNSSLQIKTYNYSGLSTISFRGTAAEHTGVYWNGFLLNLSNTNSVDFSLIPSGFFNDISILYGGGSSLFGSGSIGGSIHLNTKPDFKKGFSTRIGIKAGSFNEYTGNLATTISDNKWYSKTQFITRNSKNDFEFKNLKGESEKQKNSAIKQYGFMQDLYRNFSDKYLIGGSFWLQSNHREIPASMISKASDAKQTDESIRIMVSGKRFFRKCC